MAVVRAGVGRPVGTAQEPSQRRGWNYARVLHVKGSSTNQTNYVEWVNDPDGGAAALSVANNRIENITLLGSKYLSGVQYNTGSTANYKAEISNMYRNVQEFLGNKINVVWTYV